MRKIGYILIMALLGMGTMAKAQSSMQTIMDGVAVGDLDMAHSGDYMVVNMTLGLKKLDVDVNRAVLLTPRLVNGSDSLELPSVGIYGRRRYYFYIRNNESMLSGKKEKSFRASEKPENMAYHNIVPYSSWMNGARLMIHRSDYGCCNTLLAEYDGMLGRHAEAFFPQLVYVHPKGNAVKSDTIAGSAFIDFPVDKTVIYPDYRRNAAELGKIQASIDSVRSDRDITITSVWLKGYASPESPYSHNKELAIGRTEALKRHIQQLYKFEEGIIQTDYEPEDWEGLRRYVEQSNIDHRAEILEMIDSDLDPDAKEAKIKRTYPAQYRFLLANCYPALRHTDYRIVYTICTYTDVERIKQLVYESPQKLSLNEFYLAAQEYKPGTNEFSDVFETAARMFPNDKDANLNAANAAMRRGDLEGAERYLAKAGDSPEATYAWGALAIRRGDLDTARRFLHKAKLLGLEQAGTTLEMLETRKR